MKDLEQRLVDESAPGSSLIPTAMPHDPQGEDGEPTRPRRRRTGIAALAVPIAFASCGVVLVAIGVTAVVGYTPPRMGTTNMAVGAAARQMAVAAQPAPVPVPKISTAPATMIQMDGGTIIGVLPPEPPVAPATADTTIGVLPPEPPVAPPPADTIIDVLPPEPPVAPPTVDTIIGVLPPGPPVAPPPAKHSPTSTGELE